LGFYQSVLRPILFNFDAELAHYLAIFGLKSGLVPRPNDYQDETLRTNLWGLDFPNPIGLAAGFDKNAEVFESLLKFGFGFVETGTVTPLPQPGNPKPRMFRLVEDQAIINRLGFNNNGLDEFCRRLKEWQAKGAAGIVGANVGKNKTSKNEIEDFVTGISSLSETASYLVVNVSSPNTPGLRDLQGKEKLTGLLTAAIKARNTGAKRAPLLLKVAPDLSADDKKDIAEVAVETGIDGILATNTTVSRPESLRSKHKSETGGLSGTPLFRQSNDVLSDFYQLTDGNIPLIGIGGVSNGDDAYCKIKAGASLVQIYSSMIYEGPWVAEKIKKELAAHLRRDGFKSVQDAVGADHR